VWNYTWASFSIGAPFWGTWEGCSFPRAFERKVIFFYQENFHEKFERPVKEGSGNRQLAP
jgi:hypothetical protein